MSPRGIFTHVGIILHILDCLGQVNAGYLQVLYLGIAPRTKETLPDFLKWRRVVNGPPGFGASQVLRFIHRRMVSRRGPYRC